ncbi:lantibiotic dehydratase [Kitasatospora sp. NPDC089509]|uniref:lantibiotic dehydratase n=1 Tax=Kitasatospora sp. NPDC089509 TaxID=3364079 RepID=UPI0037F23C0B
MPDTPTFACGEVALLRAAVRPARSLPERPAPRTTESPSPQSTAPTSRDTDLDQLRAALGDELLREAVAVSSPSLSRVLDQVEAGLPVKPKQLRKAARAVTRYRLRMSDRATPFGLMAGVAVARFADRPAVRWGGRPRKAARPDQEWLTGLVAALERELPVLRGLRVTANDLCRVRDDRLVLPYLPVPGTEQRTAGRELSIRHTAAIRTVLERAAGPLSWAELHRAVLAAHPQVEGAAVDWLLGELVRTQILLTDLLPPAAEPDPIGHLLERLSGLPVAAELRAVRDDLAAYQRTEPGAGLPAWRTLTERMRRLHPTERLVQVDLGLDVEVRLPPAVRREVERAAHALWTVSAGRPGPAHLRQYHEDFLERYGLGRAVPLLDLLDPERGLGAPAGYLLPRSTRALRPGEPDDPRDELLLALAQRAAVSGERELVLDEALLARLGGTAGDATAGTAADSPGGTAPPSLDLLVELRAASPEALADGDFTLVVSGTGVTAGAMAGRFAPLLGEAGRPLTEAVRTLPTDNPEAVRAQLLFRTPRAHSANVARAPQVLPYTVTLAQFADRTDPGVLGPADLAVVADHDRLAVVSRRLGREVVPTVPHMLATDVHAPNAARLLDELSRSGGPAWPRWRWGAAERLPFLPRVRSGRTVLSPARWRPEEPELRDPALPYPQWSARLEEWRRRWRVPRVVQSVSDDQRITLDLGDERHRELLHHAWTGSADGHLQEVPEQPSDWLGAGGRSNELAFTLLRRSPGTARTPAVAPPRRRTVYGPGSSPWLYAKLYCATARQDELLNRQLPTLLEQLPTAVDRWFYLRYLDPQPHLRLRFHGDPTALRTELLPALGAWADRLAAAGLADRLVLDGYEPELERYGGPAAMAAAEQVFAADSRSCLAQLRLLHERRLGLDPLTLLAANYVDLAHHFGDLGLLTRRYRATERHHLPPAVREQARALIDPDGHWSALGRLPGGSELLASWDERAAALAAYRARLDERWSSTDTALGALLHMHHNRLVGVDRTGEERSLALARRTVRAHLGRAAALGAESRAVPGAPDTLEALDTVAAADTAGAVA